MKNIKDTIKKLNEFTKEAERTKSDLNILNIQQQGQIVFENNEENKNVTQDIIKQSVDMQTKEQAYNLVLPSALYKTAYDITGRHILIYNHNGFVSHFDAKTKHLFFENDIQEKIRAGTFLHNELFHSLSQKNVYIYNNQGVEVHCIRRMKHINHLEYLQHHFLLVGASENKLQYLDTSYGKIISEIEIEQKVNMIKQNKTNAIIATGNDKGVVCFWSPNQKDSLMKVLCHNTEIKTLEIAKNGEFMVTSGNDNAIKIWDIRNTCKPINIIELPVNFERSALSDTNLLAMACKNKLCIFENIVTAKQDYKEHIMLKDKFSGRIIHDLKFVPHEDILTVGHTLGITNLIIPGCGDPRITKASNPFRTKKERQNEEVKMLLEKIPYQMIGMTNFVDEIEEEIEHEEVIEERKRTALDRFYK